MSILSKLKAKFTSVEASGSAFLKVAETDAKAEIAKGRIIALDAVAKVKTAVADELDKEVTRVHAAQNEIKSRFDSILEKL
jgi:hypothetical protein